MEKTIKKKITLAFLYNIWHKNPDSSDSDSFLEADFDDPKAIDDIVTHLKQLGYNVIPIEANEEAYLHLYKNKEKIDLVFNYSCGIHGKDRSSHVPAMLEMLKIPYTGSDPYTQALVLNKRRAKDVFSANGIPTLPYQIFINGKEKAAKQLHFPLIVKPVSQGQSAGMTNESVVLNSEQLKERIDFIIHIFHQPVLVEPFLSGREFTIGMLGNPPKTLSIVELNHHRLPEGFHPFSSMDVKFKLDESFGKDFLTCPAKIDKTFEKKLIKICNKVVKVIDILDWCRIDIRCDRKNNPYVLEVNSPASLEPPGAVTGYTSYPLAARMYGYDYDKLLEKIIRTALKRYS